MVTSESRIETPKGVLFYLHIKQDRNEEAANLIVKEEKKAQGYIDITMNANKMNLNKAHRMFGHMGADNTKKYVFTLGLN